MTFAPNSSAARDIAYHIHGQTNIVVHEKIGPTVIERGDGVRVYDDNGKEYIEGLAGLWSVSLGFNEKRLIDAAVKQLNKLPYYHTFAHKVTPPVINLAEKLVSMAPAGMSKVIFQNSGSEAIDTAMKLVWYYHNSIGKPEKKKLITRVNAYHGTGIASGSLTGLASMHAAFDLPIERILRTDCPHYYRFGEDGESEQAFATRCAYNLEQLIIEEGPETIGAFFAEPVQGAGGVLIPAATYFEKVQKVLKKYDILLVADEVICGFGRTGNLWGSETFGMEPDMLTCAKALSSSYVPISSVLINDKIYAAMAEESGKQGIFGHGYTYSGHPVAAAVALETLKIYEEIDIVNQVQSVAPTLQDGLMAMQDHDLIGEVRGVGLIAGVELVADKASKAAFDPMAKVGAKVMAIAEENGLLIRNMGDVLALCPPLIIDEETVVEMLARFKTSLDAGAAWVSEQGLR
jgi:4-aminobutyrate--pyruvate transaminase